MTWEWLLVPLLAIVMAIIVSAFRGDARLSRPPARPARPPRKAVVRRPPPRPAPVLVVAPSPEPPPPEPQPESEPLPTQVEAPAAPVPPPVLSEVVRMLRSPRSAAAAFVLTEVLGRPRGRR